MKDKVILAAVVIIGLVGILNHIESREPSGRYLQIGQNKIEVEIADDEAERARGLSGRAVLESNHGLLFIFDAPDRYGFWMKEMNFPIDIIWLDENWRVADISKNVSPDSYPQVFYPPRPIKYVIEVNAGWSNQNNLQIGDEIQALANQKGESF